MFGEEPGPSHHDTERWGELVHLFNIYQAPTTCQGLCASGMLGIDEHSTEPSPHPTCTSRGLHSSNHRGTGDVSSVGLNTGTSGVTHFTPISQ